MTHFLTMAATKTVSRILTLSGILMMVIGGVGFIIVMVLNAFVLDEFDAYGEVPIPGAAQVQLPAGPAQISFHTSVTGSPSSGFPLPSLRLNIVPPEGVADPVLTEKNHGTLTTINSDTHIRIWTAEIPRCRYLPDSHRRAGERLHQSAAGVRQGKRRRISAWVFGGIFGLGLLDLIASLILRRQQPTVQQFTPPAHQYTPSDQGVRLEQLKTLAALRDSGALTQDEFDAEKRRILGE